MSREKKTYAGVHNDRNGGLTDAGRIIRDAWVFELIPESEDGAGWTFDRVQALYEEVYRAWAPYGHLASNLPPDLRERHQRIYDEAMSRAREAGWNPSADLEDEA